MSAEETYQKTKASLGHRQTKRVPDEVGFAEWLDSDGAVLFLRFGVEWTGCVLKGTECNR